MVIVNIVNITGFKITMEKKPLIISVTNFVN